MTMVIVAEDTFWANFAVMSSGLWIIQTKLPFLILQIEQKRLVT
jgi:hypothetical protein